jgi:U3 small nucleolar RNA-associated protein 13
MDNQNVAKSSNNYVCKICDYSTSRKNNIDKHLLTSKHLKLYTKVINDNNDNKSSNKVAKSSNTYKCLCGKKYIHQSGLCKHKKICTHNFAGHKAIVVKVCFHPDAAKMQLVSCSEDSTVKVWDLVMKQCLHSFNHGSVITDFAFHPKLNLLYVNEINFKVHVYDLSDFNRVAAIKLDKNSSCLAVMKQNKETMLFLGSEDGTISVVDANSHKLINTIESISQQYTKLIYVSNTHTLLAVTKDQNILLYDANNIENKYTHAIVGFLDEVTDIAYAITETNRYIVVSTNSEILKIFDEADPSQVSFLVGHKEIIMCLSSFKQYVASGSKDFTVKLWKISSLSEHICIGTFTGHTEVISCICLFPKQGHKLVSASQDKTLKVWDCHELLDQDDNIQINSSLFTQVAHEKAINSIKVSPNEAIIATSSQDKTIKVRILYSYGMLRHINCFHQ